MTKYEMFDHTADVGVEIFGRTKKELFGNAAWALMDIMLEQSGQKERGERQKKIAVEGVDVPDLLVNYLREILYLFNGEAMIVKQCHITECRKKSISGWLNVEPYNQKKHAVKMEIKAVTYHGLSVEKIKSGWKAKVIFDV